jgi:hypothetical protein
VGAPVWLSARASAHCITRRAPRSDAPLFEACLTTARTQERVRLACSDELLKHRPSSSKMARDTGRCSTALMCECAPQPTRLSFVGGTRSKRFTRGASPTVTTPFVDVLFELIYLNELRATFWSPSPSLADLGGSTVLMPAVDSFEFFKRDNMELSHQVHLTSGNSTVCGRTFRTDIPK